MSANARSKQYRLESYCGEDIKLTVLVGEVKPRYSGMQRGAFFASKKDILFFLRI
jgi:hypothetical protein